MDKWLVIGDGGREYSIAEQLAKNPNRSVYVAPGNIMMDRIGRVQTVDISEMDFPKLASWAKENEIVETVVGPEQPLTEGIVDYFEGQGLNIFGPTKEAAQLESSKAFAKRIMQKQDIKTANYHEFKDPTVARRFLKNQNFPIVIKANNLAGGKGVTVAKDLNEAEDAITQVEKLPHQAAILIEDFLAGEEFSLFVMANGKTAIPMPIAQDHKRLEEGDQGPNTGGMGAYSPVPQINDKLVQESMDKIIYPTLEEMEARGTPFKGFLYAGLINTKDGVQVIEFNVRMGDPETQIVLPQLKSDLGEHIQKLMNGKSTAPEWQQDDYYLGTVLASKGYPIEPKDGFPLPNLNDNLSVSYAGVKSGENELLSDGGRILMVHTHNNDLKAAQTRVNQAIKDANVDNDYVYRKDIGNRGIDYLDRN